MIHPSFSSETLATTSLSVDLCRNRNDCDEKEMEKKNILAGGKWGVGFCVQEDKDCERHVSFKTEQSNVRYNFSRKVCEFI